MKIIRSLYRDRKEDQFELEVLGETNDEYIVKLLPYWWDKFQEGNKIHKLRKCMVGGEVYELIEKEIHYEQLHLF